jgi:hypothetical protein
MTENHQIQYTGGLDCQRTWDNSQLEKESKKLSKSWKKAGEKAYW